MNSIETDSLIYQILKQSGRLDISGDVYTAGERPDNSDKEDICINNISFEHSTPKTGITNINIHVPDLSVTIGGTQQYKCNRTRLQSIAETVESIIRNTTITGVKLNIESEQLFKIDNAAEHYINIRCGWLIAKPYLTLLDVKQSEIEDLRAEITDLRNAIATLQLQVNNIVNGGDNGDI